MSLIFRQNQCFPSPEFRLTTGTAGGHAACRQPHDQDFDEIAVVREGSGAHSLGDQRIRVSQGDVLIISAGIEHAFEDKGGLLLNQVVFDPAQQLVPRPETLRLPGYHALFVLDPTDRRYLGDSHRLRPGLAQWRSLLELVDRIHREEAGRVPGFETAMRASFMQLVVSIARWHGQQIEGATPEGRLHAVLRYMESHCDRPITLGDLAAQAHMSKNNFLRVFRKEHKVTPIEFLIRLRMARACEMMQDTALSISEIAYAVGFSDSNYFSRRFREVYGLPPSRYRKSMREEGGGE
jgi:AraC-like DNA-binding protein